VTTIDSSQIRARLEFIERSLFGATLTVKRPATEPGQPPHLCVPALIETDIEDAASSAVSALALLIEDEAANLQLLRRLADVTRALQSDPLSLTKAIRLELHASYEAIRSRYSDPEAGMTAKAEQISSLAAGVSAAIGLLSADEFATPDAGRVYADHGFLEAYSIPGWSADALRERTCESCRPNFEEMLRRDIASGHWPRANAS
jgi:hypothetical protein